MFRDLAPLFGYMRRYRWGYLWGTLSCVATNTVAVQFPRVLGKAVDVLKSGTTREKILFYAGLLVAISMAKGVFLYAQRWILIGISRDIELDLRNDLFRKLEEQDSGFYQRYRTGDIMARMTNDLNAVRMLLGPALMYSANTLFFTVGALFFLLRISPYLTLVALAPMPLASILVQYFGNRIHTRFERIQASFSDISSQAQENYSGARLVRAFAREESEINLFERLNREYIRRALRLVQLMGMLWPTLEFVLGVSMIITLLAGGHLVIAHRISVGDFVEFNVYMIMLIWPIIAVGWVINIFQRGTASVTRVDELLKAEPAIDDRSADPGIAADTVLKGEIEFRNLNFNYGDTAVLHEISLRIPAGSSLAIVGPTGCGKSTLVSLISRLYEAPEGELLIDGRPVREYPLAEPGDFSVQRNDPREPGLRSAECQHRRAAGSRRGRTYPQGVRGVSARLSDHRRRTRRHAVWRTETTLRNRTCTGAQACHSHPRRCAGQRGHLHRRAHPWRVAYLYRNVHYHPHLTPRLNRAQCRSDRRA